jgi:hypothetical protein
MKNDSINLDEQTTYSVYPLILCDIILSKLQELNLYQQYITELKVNYIYVDIEYNGITINQNKLEELTRCMNNFLEINIIIVLEYFKILLPELTSTWLLFNGAYIEYKYGLFIPIFKQFSLAEGYKEPFLEINELIPKSWKYFKAYILRNTTLPSELKSKLKLLQLILQMRNIYENKIDELKNNIKQDGKIHPCINSIGYNFGRLLTNAPNIHFAPNTETSQWGKYYRRCLQSKKGYKFIKADWKSQELYTLALLINDSEFTKTLSGDFHINTGKILFPDQSIQINHIIDLDSGNKLIEFDFSKYIQNITGISLYNDNYYYTPSEIKKNSKNTYEMKIPIDKINSLGIRKDSQINYITNEQRQISKRLNFGLMYSEPIGRFQEHLQIDIETIKSYIDKWWLIYPKITQYIENVRKKANIHGFCQTFKGRRMFFPELLENSDVIILDEQKRDILLTFINSGTAADLLKHSIILINDLIQKNGYDAHIVHTLHDEIIIEVLERDIDKVKIIINDVMTKLAFPEFLERGINITADIDVCLWWDKCKDNENMYDFTIDEDDCPNFI